MRDGDHVPARPGTGPLAPGSVGVFVVVDVRGVRVVVVVGLGLLARRRHGPTTDLTLQGVEIHRGGAVLELSGHLCLLGLGPAAPHGSSPLQQGRGGRMSRRPHSSGVMSWGPPYLADAEACDVAPVAPLGSPVSALDSCARAGSMAPV